MKKLGSVRQRLFQQKKLRFLLLTLLGTSFTLGMVIVPVEREVGKIDSYFDGLWWAVTTLTTVGYGDYVPITDLGRVIGIILQLIGTMMFGMVIAIISSYVSRIQDEFYWRRLFERTDRLEEMVGELIKKSDFMVKDGHNNIEEE